MKDFPIYLSTNFRGMMSVPDSMTAKDYELLKRQIVFYLTIIEATAVIPPPPASPAATGTA